MTDDAKRMFKALGWTVAIIVAVFTFVAIMTLVAETFPVVVGALAIVGFFVVIFAGVWSIVYGAMS